MNAAALGANMAIAAVFSLARRWSEDPDELHMWQQGQSQIAFYARHIHGTHVGSRTSKSDPASETKRLGVEGCRNSRAACLSNPPRRSAALHSLPRGQILAVLSVLVQLLIRRARRKSSPLAHQHWRFIALAARDHPRNPLHKSASEVRRKGTISVEKAVRRL